jgi:DUF438 domain-containing protein
MEQTMEQIKERLLAEVKTKRKEMKFNQEEMMAMLKTCLEKMEANPEEITSVAVHHEVRKEETIGALEDRYGDRRHIQPKKGPRAMVGPGRSWAPPVDG